MWGAANRFGELRQAAVMARSFPRTTTLVASAATLMQPYTVGLTTAKEVAVDAFHFTRATLLVKWGTPILREVRSVATAMIIDESEGAACYGLREPRPP